MKIPAIALIAAALAAAPSVTRAQNLGATDYKNRCARCHTPEQAVEFLKKHPDAKERAAWLDKKLSRHHARDAAQRARIIAYLESLLAASK